MAPIEDPQLVTYVLVQHPKLKAGEYGSDPVSKLFTYDYGKQFKVYEYCSGRYGRLLKLMNLGNYEGNAVFESN